MATAAIVIGAITAGALIATAFMTSATDTGTQSPNDIDWTTNNEGDPIPEVLGTVKLSGNYIWTGQLECHEQSSSSGKGGSSSTTTGYKYYMEFAIGLCMGPVDKLLAIYEGADLVWGGTLSCPDSGVSNVSIEGIGSVTFYFGTQTQAANSRIATGLDDTTLNTPYPGLCYAVFNKTYIGESAQVPTYYFVVQRAPDQSFGGTALLSSFDYNPAHAVWHILTEMVGLPSSWLDSASFLSVAETLETESRGISIEFGSQETALDYIENILSHIVGMLRFGSDGKFHLSLARNDYDEDTVPVITEAECLEPPTIKRPAWSDTVNEVKVTFNERTYDDGTNTPYVIFMLWIDESSPSYWELDFVDGFGQYHGTAGPYWDDDVDAAIAKIDEISEHADVSVSVFDVGYETNDSGSFFITKTAHIWPNEGGMSTWPGYVANHVNCYRDPAPTSYFFKGHFKAKLPSGYAQREGYLYLTVDTSGSMNMDTINPAYDTFKAWVEETYPDITIIENNESRSDERWLSWIVSDLDLERTFTGPDYEDAVCDPIATNLANQQQQGMVVSETLDLGLFTTNANAVWAAQESLRKLSYPLATLSAELNRDAFRLQPGDVFKFQYAPYGIEAMYFRLTQIDEEDLESETISITAEEEYTSVSSILTTPATYTKRSSASTSYAVDGDALSWTETHVAVPGESFTLETTSPTSVEVADEDGNLYTNGTDYYLDGGEVNILDSASSGSLITAGEELTVSVTTKPEAHVRFVEMPYVWAGADIKVLPLVSRPNTINAGFYIYTSTSGESYSLDSTENTFCVYGELLDDYPTTFQIDDEVGFRVSFLTDDVDSIESCTREQLLGSRNLALLGDELITVQTIEPVTERVYLFTGIYRGRFGTEQSAHEIGEDFFFIGSSPPEALTSTEFTYGETRYFKAVQYNAQYSSTEASEDAYELTFTGLSRTPYTPQNMIANDKGFHPEYSTGVVLEWSGRERGSGAGTSGPSTSDTEPEWEGLFRLDVYSGDTLALSVSALDALTYTLTQAALTTAEVHGDDLTCKLYNYRTVSGVTYISDAAELTVYYGG